MLKTKNKRLRYVITFFAVLCSSLLQTFVIESFVHSAGKQSGQCQNQIIHQSAPLLKSLT